VAMKDGRAVEEGTHDELMRMGGVYYSLVKAQAAKDDEEGQDNEDVDDSEEKSLSTHFEKQ